MNHQTQQPQTALSSCKATLEQAPQTNPEPQGLELEPGGAVVATLVPDPLRMEFLPFYFGTRRMLRGEALVFAWIGRLCEAYSGGYWAFYTLSNGGFYMAPDRPDAMHLEVQGNGFSGDVSADAAGVIATLFALCQLCEEVQGAEDADALTENFQRLREFADGHAEAAAIFRAID